ncbi:MAG: hypothetical protein Q4A83_03875 [Bacillota bacterium]|nr:hypothetical protein [Bacillota bacterium]
MFGIAIGILFILFGVLTLREEAPEREKISAEFTRLSPSTVNTTRSIYRAYFSFEYKDKFYETNAPVNGLEANNFIKGRHYDIYINPEKPDDASFLPVTEEPARGLVFLAVGAIALIISIPLLFL